MFYLISCDFFLSFCSEYRNFLFLCGVAPRSGLVSPDIARNLVMRELDPTRVMYDSGSSGNKTIPCVLAASLAR